MFKSFFPKPKLLLLSFVLWFLFCIIVWYVVARDAGQGLSIGELFGYGYLDGPPADSDAAKSALAAAQSHAALKIALVYVIVATIFRFFVSHYVFRWRTAMNAHYTALWPKLRHIEGASQRVQEDTMRFATISEDLGANMVDSVMTLIAFLPLLWALSANVDQLPIIGPVTQGLVIVAVLWSIIGTALVAIAGFKLPGLEFRNQRVEAAYRKELVYGEDSAERAQPPTLRELFRNVRSNYFRLYFHYLYFNVVRISYLQVGALVPYIALGPSIISGGITLGIMQQIVRAFGRVESSFQYLVNSWKTIIELLSVYKRLKAFESAIEGEPLPAIDRRYMERRADE